MLEILRAPPSTSSPAIGSQTFREQALFRASAMAGYLILPVLCLFEGWSLATNHAAIQLLIVVIIVGTLLSRVPWLAYPLLLGAVATVAFTSPSVGLTSSLDVSLAEVVLFVGLFAIHLSKNSRVPYTALDLSIAALLVTAIAGLAVGVDRGATLGEGLADARVLFFFSAFWPAAAAFANARSRRLLFHAAVGFACATVTLQVLQIFVGPGRVLFYASNPFQELITCSQGACGSDVRGFIRVRPPGLMLVYIVCSFALCYLLWGPRRGRPRAFALFAVTFTGVLLSLNRNMVIGLLLGILAAVLAVRQRRGLVTLSVATAVTLLVALAGTGVGGEVGKRIRSIGDLEGTAKSSSVADREYENQLAVDAIINDPIEGIGLGTSYGAATTDVSGNVVPRKWIHNQYLELWLRTGLAGLLSWLVVLGTSLAYATRWCRRNGNEPPWLGAGVVCAVVAFAASSVAGIYVLSVPSAVAFVGVIALARSLGLESRVTQTVGRPRETSASPRGAFSS